MEPMPSSKGMSWGVSWHRTQDFQPTHQSLSLKNVNHLGRAYPVPFGQGTQTVQRQPLFGAHQPTATVLEKVMDFGAHPLAKIGFILSCLAAWVALSLMAPAYRAQILPPPTAEPTPDPRIPDFPGRDDLQGLLYENTVQEGDNTVVYALYRFGDEVKGERLNAEEAIRIEITLNRQGKLQHVSYNLNPFYSYHPGGSGYEAHMKAADAFRQWVAGSIDAQPYSLLDETQDSYPGRNYLRVIPNGLTP